jgi:hypothetical protein
MQSAYDRVVRILVVSVGVGSVLFTLLGVPGILEEHGHLNPVFSYPTIAVFCGLPPLMALVAFRAPVRALRVLAIVHAVSSLAFLVLWVPSITDPGFFAGRGLPWLINTIAVATCEAAIALPFLISWAYMLVVAIASGLVRFMTFADPNPAQAVQDTIMMLLLSGFLMALIQLTLRAGSEQDIAAAEAQDEATATAARSALDRQRARYNDATRDEVVLALDTAVQNSYEARLTAGELASTSLRKLDPLTRQTALAVTTPVAELDVALRTVAVGEGISYAFSQTADEQELEIPTEVADALVVAATEAMRNSIQHADRRGRTTARTVRATRLPQGVEIIIRDDGRGFNPGRIGVDRLGVRLSILERVNALPGAHADIVSTRGRGTVVTLIWKAAFA